MLARRAPAERQTWILSRFLGEVAESILLTLASAPSHNAGGVERLRTDTAALERAAVAVLAAGGAAADAALVLRGLSRYADAALTGSLGEAEIAGLSPSQLAMLSAKFRA